MVAGMGIEPIVVLSGPPAYETGELPLLYPAKFGRSAEAQTLTLDFGDRCAVTNTSLLLAEGRRIGLRRLLHLIVFKTTRPHGQSFQNGGRCEIRTHMTFTSTGLANQRSQPYLPTFH